MYGGRNYVGRKRSNSHALDNKSAKARSLENKRMDFYLRHKDSEDIKKYCVGNKRKKSHGDKGNRKTKKVNDWL